MELADSLYNYEKYKTTLDEQFPNARNEIVEPLRAMASDVQRVDLQGVSDVFSRGSTLEGCDLPHCKAIKTLEELLKCEGPVCDTLRSAADWIKNGPSPSGECNDPLCAMAEEIDNMLKNPQDCTNPLCEFVKNIFGENILSAILMEILNFILGPFKGPFTTLMIAVTGAVLAMFLMLLYLIFFK